jgi:ADP-ribose pyrophosphatase YjhB (NUDIX family)
MNPSDAYKHCLLCGSTLEKKEKRLLVCTNCGYHHYINPFPCNAVIIENEKGEILLVKRKFDPQKGYWDLPGGFIEPHENLETSAKREIKEELNIDITINKIVGVYQDTYIYQNIEVPTLGIAVSAKITSGELHVADDISGYQYFPKEQVLQQKIAFKSVEQAIKDYLGSRD